MLTDPDKFKWITSLGFSGFLFLASSIILLFAYDEGHKETYLLMSNNQSVATGYVNKIDTLEVIYHSDYDRPRTEYSYVYYYSFPVKDSIYSDKAYSKTDPFDINDQLKISYLEKDPNVSTVEGMRNANSPFWVVVILIILSICSFPVVLISLFNLFLR